MTAPTECTRCHERYPSHYYFVQGATPPVCVRCVEELPPAQQGELLKEAAAASGDTLRRCLRCQTPMVRGDLIYRDSGGSEITQVRQVKWGLARRESRFFVLVSKWVIERAIPIDAWRCKACGYCELATGPDPTTWERASARAGETEDSTLL